MKGVSKKLRSQLAIIRDILAILGKDTIFCLGKLDDELTNPGISSADVSQLNFWLKSAIRSFLAQVEGVTSAMRWSVVRAAEEGHIKLEAKEVAQLQERRYDKKTGEIGPAFRGRFDDNFKNAFRHFPRVFGSDWNLKLQGEGWERFRKLVSARDDFTHPKDTTQLFRGSVGEDLHVAVAWFNSNFSAMLSEIGRRLGKEISFPSNKAMELSELARSKLALVIPPPRVGSPSALLCEIEFMDLLKNDERIAYEIFSGGASMQNGRLSIGTMSQLGARLYTRTLFTEIEAFGQMAQRLLDNSAAKDEISFSEEEQELLSTKDLVLKIANRAELFSRKFGHDRVIDKTGRTWLAFSRVAEFRDRITHPKIPEDLHFDMDTLDAIVDTIDWHCQLLDALELSEKYVGLPLKTRA